MEGEFRVDGHEEIRDPESITAVNDVENMITNHEQLVNNIKFSIKDTKTVLEISMIIHLVLQSSECCRTLPTN